MKWLKSKRLFGRVFSEPFQNLAYTNSGGCGKVALLMSEQLTKQGIKHSIHVWDRFKHGVSNFKLLHGVEDINLAYEKKHC